MAISKSKTETIRILEGNAAKDFSQSLETRAREQVSPTLESRVSEIIELVRTDGDRAIAELAARFGDKSKALKKSKDQVQELLADVKPERKETIEIAAERIRAFASAIRKSIQPVSLDYSDFQVGLEYKPVRRVACYVPAGRYPLPSTALMTAITAQVAGVEEIIILSPDLRPEIVFAGSLAGVEEFYEVGGAQAIAAAALGTETIAAVDMIVGPGNAYVTEAKRQLQGTIGIDMLAGPSEICAIADEGINPEWAALDLLSQAEHAPDAIAYLLTPSAVLAKSVQNALSEKLEKLELPEYVLEALAQSAIVVVDSLDDCCELANKIAPEHLLLLVERPDELAPKLDNYGAIFKGYGSTVAYGDYMAGPNHTLPTGQTARFQGCLSPLTFLRSQSYVSVPGTASRLSKETADFADIEGLRAHSAAARVRLQGDKKLPSK